MTDVNTAKITRTIPLEVEIKEPNPYAMPFETTPKGFAVACTKPERVYLFDNSGHVLQTFKAANVTSLISLHDGSLLVCLRAPSMRIMRMSEESRIALPRPSRDIGTPGLYRRLISFGFLPKL
jgi:hypothetical protein